MSVEPAPTSPRRPDRPALVIALILAGVAGIIAWDAAHLRAVGGYAGIGPAGFSYFVAAGLGALSAGTVVAALRSGFPTRETEPAAPILWIVGGLAAQMILLKLAGFSAATACLFAATARGFGRGPVWLSFVFGLILSLAIYVTFARGLGLSLPAGPLERLVP